MVTGVTAPTATMTANIIGSQPTLKDAPVKSDRRSNKPIMEKRRRARINNCLNELKTLILDATKKDPARHSKLEKADILEKTVKHLQELQRQQAALAQAADPKVINKFKAGFTDCANEVSRFPGLDPVVKRRLLQHLSNCINGVKSELHHHHRQQQQQSSVVVQQPPSHMLPSPPSSPEQQDQPMHHTSPNPPPQIIHSINGGYFLPNGLQVIPTKLPNGSIALVLPQTMPHNSNNNTNNNNQPPMLVPIPSRTASTGSASSHTSSSYERTLSPPTNIHYAPPSPANSYEAMDCKPSVIHHGNSAAAAAAHAAAAHHQQMQQQMYHHQQQQQQQQHAAQHQHYNPEAAPLSLVVKKIKQEEEQPWRPW
ncbi:protein hairy [Episyrphus balteatus]|uniref:protein hairy n=1 Tax=Episyrphus balteatus TaxID=286459 RepID=UPI002485C144|nr:protein hairy [Episyrphus balteatus]